MNWPDAVKGGKAVGLVWKFACHMEATEKGGATMSAAANKEIVQRLFEEAWNQNRLAELDEYISADNVTHPGTSSWRFGPEAARELMKVWRTGFTRLSMPGSKS
jgi:hypothetical protein